MSDDAVFGFGGDFFCGLEIGSSIAQEQSPAAWAAEVVAAGARPSEHAEASQEAGGAAAGADAEVARQLEGVREKGDEGKAASVGQVHQGSEEATKCRRACETSQRVLVGDCFDILDDFEDDTFDMAICSPPYENLRSYDVGFNLKGQDWVDWAVERYMKCVRVTKGLVVWVVEGSTRNFRWSATPALLMADLHRKGVKLRKPPIYVRDGIPGSGGRDWWKNRYELCVASSKGKLPWSENTATGHPPKYKPGGNPSHQSRDGRVNKPRAQREGDTKRVRTYKPPKLANPGNIIKCSGGHLGDKLAHENEGPFPESLVIPFIKCFCPPGGTVLDPFCGSGTVLAVAKKLGRNAIGIDIRQSQADLTLRRLTGITVAS